MKLASSYWLPELATMFGCWSARTLLKRSRRYALMSSDTVVDALILVSSELVLAAL